MQGSRDVINSIKLITFTILFISTVFLSASVQAADNSPYKPDHPYTQYVDGLLKRDVFVEIDPPFQIDEIDLLIGPGIQTAETDLPGGAVFEIRSGSGEIIINGKPFPIELGDSIDINQGAIFQIMNNRDDLGITIRATVVTII